MLKNIIYSVFVILIFSVACSCTREKEPQTIFEEQQSGVCVVLNSYYYEIILPNGNKWFCKGIDEEGDLDGLTFDESEIIKDKGAH